MELDEAGVRDDLVPSFDRPRHLDCSFKTCAVQRNLSFCLVWFSLGANKEVSSADKDVLTIQVQLRQVLFIVEEAELPIDCDDVKDWRVFQVVDDILTR